MSMKHWNSTSGSSPTINRTTGVLEFSYNNAPNVTTGVSPFFANKGYDPTITIHPEYELASSQAHKFVTDLSELHEELQKAILLSQEHYQHSTDKNRIPPLDFKGGDRVFVKAKFFHTTHPTKKFSEKYLSPYEIINQACPLSWTLHLPDTMRTIHPVFHVSMLEPSTLNSIPDRTQPPLPQVLIDGKPEYEISEILDSKLDNQCHICKLLYLVRWFGYEGTDEETSWLPTNKPAHASNIVSDFHSKYPSKPSPLSIQYNLSIHFYSFHCVFVFSFSLHSVYYLSVLFPSYSFLSVILFPSIVHTKIKSGKKIKSIFKNNSTKSKILCYIIIFRRWEQTQPPPPHLRLYPLHLLPSLFPL